MGHTNQTVQVVRIKRTETKEAPDDKLLEIESVMANLLEQLTIHSVL